MSSTIETLTKLLDEAASLLNAYEQTGWAEWLAKDAMRIRSHDGYGIEHLLSAYGGMGSLNDVVLQRSNGVEVTMDFNDNERFNKLRSEIYDLAMACRPAVR
ncbi:DUF6966 domain-containing protein [Ralstonia chuxiongensis]|uniref:DUF6966 domain-containing protein n=1 Tax=Ralstonia chuxiongensis TaxID=2957504 RepID=UPI0028F4FD4A|nr:hypothetical protein [Ralstonia chuxiongensis]CAJ0772427.1 hypothetical protein R8510_02612 [Ralstonia chuxiongensis]